MSVFLRKKLPLNTFLFEFDNVERAYGRNSCYICFALKPTHAVGATGTAGSGLWGYATSKREEVADGSPRGSPGKGGAHAEELLLDEMTRHVGEHRGASFCVEWFSSWSPCDRCSGLLRRWLRVAGRRHRLRLWFSRIYRGGHAAVRAGLRRLRRAGVQLGVMDAGLHECCAYALVDAARGDPAPPWLLPWHRNVPRVQRAFDEIMDEDDDWSDNSDPGKLLESTSGGHESWDDDDWYLLLEDLTVVVECTPSKQGPPEATAAPTLPRKRQGSPVDASAAKRALF